MLNDISQWKLYWNFIKSNVSLIVFNVFILFISFISYLFISIFNELILTDNQTIIFLTLHVHTQNHVCLCVPLRRITCGIVFFKMKKYLWTFAQNHWQMWASKTKRKHFINQTNFWNASFWTCSIVLKCKYLFTKIVLHFNISKRNPFFFILIKISSTSLYILTFIL